MWMTKTKVSKTLMVINNGNLPFLWGWSLELPTNRSQISAFKHWCCLDLCHPSKGIDQDYHYFQNVICTVFPTVKISAKITTDIYFFLHINVQPRQNNSILVDRAIFRSLFNLFCKQLADLLSMTNYVNFFFPLRLNRPFHCFLPLINHWQGCKHGAK